jgi:glutamate---cysteine ligase / carboxylate-amine ligase
LHFLESTNMSFDRFKGSARPSLGVELELQLLDAHSLALTAASAAVLASVPSGFENAIKPEFYDSCVEINTGVCRDIDEVRADLQCKLDMLKRVASGHGVLFGWGGTHPFSHWRDQTVVSTPRYCELAEYYRETLCRQVTFGLHIHVGVTDGDTAVRACDRIVEHLPTLLALSVNSPFWCGRATGLQSHRVEIMGASPTGGLPPRLVDWDDYIALVERLGAAGLIGTAKDLWWDVRPSAEHGTVEVRMCDMPQDLESVLGLTALIQCLVVALAGEDRGWPGLDECGLAIARQNRWRAARFGLGAELVDLRNGRRWSARRASKDLAARLRGIAESLGCVKELALVDAMADGPSGAEQQLATLERTGDLREVVRREMLRPWAPFPAYVAPEIPPVDVAGLVHASAASSTGSLP